MSFRIKQKRSFQLPKDNAGSFTKNLKAMTLKQFIITNLKANQDDKYLNAIIELIARQFPRQP